MTLHKYGHLIFTNVQNLFGERIDFLTNVVGIFGCQYALKMNNLHLTLYPKTNPE